MNTELPKQFLLVGQKPIIIRTIEQFIAFDANINLIIVLPQNYHDYFFEIAKKHQLNHPFLLVNGGNTRFQSVKNGLQVITSNGIVGIHDAVRPFVSVSTLQNCYSTAKKLGNAVPYTPVVESLREITKTGNVAVSRDRFKIIQTPQCFNISLLKQAFQVNYQESFTDDATVFEHSGQKINLVIGNPENIKITTPVDLTIAQAYISLSNK